LRAFWRTIARCWVASLALVLSAAPARAAGSAPPLPSVEVILANYTRATTEPGAEPIVRLESFGAIRGAGLTGTFHSWMDGDDERDDQSLGPRFDSVLRRGELVYDRDANGAVRQFTGVMLRRTKTDRFIDSGDFAKYPERVKLRGQATVNGRRAFVLDVNAEGGELETLYLDAQSWLPLQIAYDDDDGRTTVDLSDWRTIDGHRFPFASVQSDGDHAYDVTSTTQEVKLEMPIDPAVFSVPPTRAIETNGIQTVPLQLHNGHLFVPVQIGGKSYSFLLDSGSQDVVVDARVLREQGLQGEGALEASGATRTSGLKLARLPELDIGGARMRDLVVTTLDLGSATGGAFKIDGILGYPFFAAAAVRIDLVAMRMTFGVPGSLPVLGEALQIETDRQFPEAHARLNQTVDGLFIIDTGNAGSMLIYGPFFALHPGLVEHSDTVHQNYGIGGSTGSMPASLDSIALGSASLYHVDTDVMRSTSGAFADRFDAGNVGLGILRNFVVTFDESRDQMYLQKSAAFDDGRSKR